MNLYEVNEHGVPQYPKSHAGRLLVTLAAIDKLERATATSVAVLTGLSKGKINDYVLVLNAQYGTRIKKDGPVFSIESWGNLLKPAGVRLCLRQEIAANTQGENEERLLSICLEHIRAESQAYAVEVKPNQVNCLRLNGGYKRSAEPRITQEVLDSGIRDLMGGKDFGHSIESYECGRKVDGADLLITVLPKGSGLKVSLGGAKQA